MGVYTSLVGAIFIMKMDDDKSIHNEDGWMMIKVMCKGIFC